jgi:hypothetical protein
MKKLIPLLFLTIAIFCGNAHFAQSPNFNWVNGIGNSATTAQSWIEKDVSGNIYISGGFIGTTDFDPGPGVVSLTSQNTTYGDHYLLKLDPNGNFMWVKQWNFNPTNNFNMTAGAPMWGFMFKVNSNGIFITGSFTGTSDFNPGPAVNAHTANGGGWWDAFILKLDLNGNYVWSQKYGGQLIDCGRGLDFDNNQNIYLIGYFSTTVSFNNGGNSLNSFGGTDSFILKLDPNGNFAWVKQFGGPSDDDFGYIQVDGLSNIYFGGGSFLSSTIDMDPGPGVSTIVSNGGSDIALGKLDFNGNFLWAKVIGNSTQNFGGLRLNKFSNQLVVFTDFSGNIDLDPGPAVVSAISNGGRDVAVVSLDPSGNYLWHTNFGGQGNEAVAAIDFDGNGRIYITGGYSQTVDFDPGPIFNNLTSQGLTDVFITTYSAAGTYVNTTSFGGLGEDRGYSLACQNPNYLYLTGTYSNTVDFDPNSGSANLTSAGQLDHFILKLNTSFCGYTIIDTVTIYDTTYTTVTDTLIINTVLTGLPAPNNMNSIKVFPNPASTHVTIDYGNYIIMNGYQLRIENALGQQVFQTNIIQQVDYLSVSTWGGNGIYFVHIIDSMGNSVDIRKIVLQ